MSVWAVLPSARPVQEAAEVLEKWDSMGYRLAIIRQGSPIRDRYSHRLGDIIIPTDRYLGFGKSINILTSLILASDSEMTHCVMIGDDLLPDATLEARKIANLLEVRGIGLFSVTQPTGDRYNNGAIDHVAACPWLGREWIQRAYMGYGPLPVEYLHYYVDNELQLVAQREGCFHQLREVKQEHKHWSFRQIRPPEYIETAHYNVNADMELFERRQRADFPGSQVLLPHTPITE